MKDGEELSMSEIENKVMEYYFSGYEVLWSF